MKPTKTDSADAPGIAVGAERQRIDKWMWHARLVRTRSAAAELAGKGHVRVNGVRIDAPSRKVALDDVLTVALNRLRVVKVRGFAERRGGAEDAVALYEDLSPPVPKEPAPPERTGPRPTKRDRRAIDRLQKAEEP